MSDTTPYIWTPLAGTGGAKQSHRLPPCNRPSGLRRSRGKSRNRSCMADAGSLQILRRSVLSQLRPDAGCFEGASVGTMVRRRHHQHRAELPRQAPRHGGVGSDLSGLGRRRQARTPFADLPRIRPRCRPAGAGAARRRHRAWRRGRHLHAEPARDIRRVLRDPETRRNCHAVVLGLRSCADPVTPEPWRGEGGDHRRRHVAAWRPRRRSNPCSTPPWKARRRCNT